MMSFPFQFCIVQLTFAEASIIFSRSNFAPGKSTIGRFRRLDRVMRYRTKAAMTRKMAALSKAGDLKAWPITPPDISLQLEAMLASGL